MAVEVDVTVDHAVLDEALGLDRADFAGLLGRRRLVDNRLVVGASHPREVDGVRVVRSIIAHCVTARANSCPEASLSVKLRVESTRPYSLIHVATV